MFEQKINQIKERILLFIDYKRISRREFCTILGINPSNLGKSNLKSDLGGDVLSKILLNFSEISPNWLMTGKGEMLTCGINNNSIIGSGNNNNQIIGNNSHGSANNNVNNNTGDVVINENSTEHLIAILETKENLIGKLRKQLEEEKDRNNEEHKRFVGRLDEKEKRLNLIYDEYQKIIKNAYDRNEENRKEIAKLSENLEKKDAKIENLNDKIHQLKDDIHELKIENMQLKGK